VDDLEPLWHSLQEHHAGLAPRLDGAKARTPSGAWRLRRPRYLAALADPDAFVMIAEQAERPVGYALVSLGQSPSGWDLGDRVADVETLSILPSARGRGIGSALMDAVEDELARLGVSA
jgi:GNAT superfamily N-acetyltransferase